MVAKRKDKRRGSVGIPGVLAVTMALAVTALLALGINPTHADHLSMLGVDVEPEGNSAASLGTIETCTEAEVGDEFIVDVYVQNIRNLIAWELRIAYDHNIISLEDAEYDLFLLSAEPHGSIFPSLFDLETPNRYFLAAAEFRGTPDDGSGVLMRLHIKAIGPGRSPLTVVPEPNYLAPRLINASGQLIGDADGDGMWDNDMTSGEVVVGDVCPPSPSPSPPPPPPQPDDGHPSDSPSDGNEPSGDSTQKLVADILADGGLAALADVAPPSDDSTQKLIADILANGGLATLADVAPSSDEGTASNEFDVSIVDSDGSVTDDSGPPVDGAADQSEGSNAEERPPADDAGFRTDEDSSSGLPLWLLAMILAAALVIGTGGSVILYTLRARR